MLKRIEFIVIILIYINFKIGQSAKYWINDDDDNRKEFFNLHNWENNLPCSIDTIVFPKQYPPMILQPIDLNIQGIDLPINGALIFNNNNTTISFTDSLQKSDGHKCLNHNHLAQIKSLSKKIKSWFDPSNWKTTKNGKIRENSATPHIERIPCSHEFAYIDIRNGPINIIDMDNIDKLEIGGFNMGGYNITSESFEKLLFTDLAHIIFQNADDIQVRYLDKIGCRSCHRPEMEVNYNKYVCKYVKKSCENNYPKCIEPIIPTGHCCEVCGSMVKLIIDDCRSFNLKHFNELIENAINDYGMKNKLDFDATFLYDGNEQYVQLVILDRYDYQERSIDFMTHINDTILKKYYKKFTQNFHVSGMAYDKENTSSGFKYIYAPLLAVIVFFIIIYVHFVPENPYIRLPPWLYTSRYNIFNSPFVFARFDNSQNDDNSIAGEISSTQRGGDSVVMKLQYEDLKSVENNNEDNNEGGTSFDNPMFSERNNEIEDFGTVEATELTEISLEES